MLNRPVFDSNTDTYDALHDRSPFAVDCICMVAARVRDGGGVFRRYIPTTSADILITGKPSEVHTKCLEEVQSMSRATLFSPVTGAEAVQAMSKHLSHFALQQFMVLQYWFLVGLIMDG